MPGIYSPSPIRAGPFPGGVTWKTPALKRETANCILPGANPISPPPSRRRAQRASGSDFHLADLDFFAPSPDQSGPLCPAETRRCKSKGLDRRCCDVSRLVGLVRLNSEFASSGEMLDPTCPLCTRTARSHHDESGCHD